MADRSARREVRNPMLAIPAVRAAIAEMSSEDRARWRRIMLAIRDDARDRADKAWCKHKPPIAAYWAAVGVLCNHLSRILR
jgi:NADPH-dependent ferric siderophore reductase